MSAPASQLADMSVADLELVCAIEQRAYSFPWSRGNFTDSLAAGYLARTLWSDGVPARRGQPAPALLGYCVAMPGVDEMHLLNITVAPEYQRQGHARTLMADLLRASRAQAAQFLWLEVRESNERARHVYQQAGFAAVGRRRAYYPLGHGRREDALVLRLPLTEAAAQEVSHGLD